MKILCTWVILFLLTGCSDFLFLLKSEQKIYSDTPSSKVIKETVVDKTYADKAKTPSTTQDPSKNLTTSTVNSTKPVNIKPFSPTKILKVGSQGEDVLALKKQLADLHYDVGWVDSSYDQQTRQGVMAFQKYNQLERTGTYTLETQKAVYLATRPDGLFPELGLPRIEIDITRQVLLFFDAQGLNRVIPVSTGTNRKYCELSKKSGKQVCGVANTPRGTFSIQSRIYGKRESDLGVLYNPLYFNGGFAIHGSPSVPNYNASHGCVRIPIATSVWFYESIQNGTPVIVFN